MASENALKYAVRLGGGQEDVSSVQRLRHLCFIETADAPAANPRPAGLEGDHFDAICTHVMVEDQGTGTLVGCCRLLLVSSGAEIEKSYSAQFYDLSGLKGYQGPMVELGRFCTDPSVRSPDILRLAWAAVTDFVDEHGIEMLFGCSSFHGTNAQAYEDSFALLARRHKAPQDWMPCIKAPSVLRFADQFRRAPDQKRALLSMPPLLRSYLQMGGWVSDHAVVDRDLGTLHVFTGLEVAMIPPARRKTLRSLARARIY